MKNALNVSVLFVALLSLNSCFVNRTTVGNGPVGKGHETATFSHQKQMYLLWGLVSIGQAQPKLPMDCGYQVRTSFNAIDAIVSTITGGIFSMRTQKVFVFRDSPCDPKIIKQEHQVDKQERKIQQEEMHQGK